MGLWNTIKGWFNISGVKVKLAEVEKTIQVGAGTIEGKVILTAKGDKEVISVKCKVINEVTTKKDDEEESEQYTLGDISFTEGFTMAKDEVKEIPFSFEYHVDEKMSHMGGVAGALGKFGAFASGTKDEYYLLAECDVKGTMLDPSDRVDLKVVKPS